MGKSVWAKVRLIWAKVNWALLHMGKSVFPLVLKIMGKSVMGFPEMGKSLWAKTCGQKFDGQNSVNHIFHCVRRPRPKVPFLYTKITAIFIKLIRNLY